MKPKEAIAKLIDKIAGEPEGPIQKFKRHGDLDRHYRAQYFKMATTAGLSGVGGIVTGTALSIGSMASLLRCIASMTYAYGHESYNTVEKADFYGVLAVWMGKEPGDVVGQLLKVYNVTRAPIVAARAVERAANKAAEPLLERLALYVAEKMSARFLVGTIKVAVPVVSSAVMVAVVTRDYNNIKKAIERYYTEKSERTAA